MQIEIEPRRLLGIEAAASIFARPQLMRDPLLSPLVRQLYREFRAEDEAAALGVEGLVFELLAQAARSGRSRERGAAAPEWLHAALEFVRAHFREPLALHEVAAHAGVHPSHLAKTFRKHEHTTLSGYVRRLRIAHALRQLADSDVSVADVALGAGFYDQSHFTHAFRSVTGTTPARYRADFRRADPELRAQPHGGNDLPKKPGVSKTD